jgi:hypothetical protein
VVNRRHWLKALGNTGYPIRVYILELSAEARRQGAIWLAFDVVALLDHTKGCIKVTDKIPVPTGAALTALDPTFRENPHEYLDYLRLTEAVRQDREFDRAMLTRAQDISSILNDSTLSSDPRKSRPGSFSRIQLGVEETFKPSMLHMDDPDHKRLRDLVSKAFSQRSVESMRGRIDEIASRLLDEVADSSTFDVMEADARIGKDNVDSALLLRDLSIQAAQISQLRNIALHCSNIPADQPYGCVEFFLPPSRDEDICALPQQTALLSPIRYRCYHQ